jgi:hypothetical protein
MTHQHESSPAGESNLGPGVAPSFGDVPGEPFEHTPERLVLSSDEHTRLSAPALAEFGGAFASEQLGRGTVSISETGKPGEVHVAAKLSTGREDLEIEADVRTTWLVRAAHTTGAEPANVQVLRALLRLAELPRQSTVRVRAASR